MAEACEFNEDTKEYNLLAVIGKACHGAASVSVARHVPSEKHYAVKIIHLDKLDECDMELSLVQHEVLMCKKLNHKNILPVLHTFVHSNQLWTVSPLMGFGSCKDLIHAHFTEGLPEQAVAYILRDVLQALDYLHHKGIIHRSVKASHITIAGDGVCCLSGLRYSMCILERGNRCANVFDYPDHYITSLLWAAPEILQQNLAGYNTSSDIYSVGITACELANGVVPFSDMPTTQMLLEKLEGTMPRLLDSTTVPELSMEDTDEENVNRTLPYQRTFSQHFHNFVDLCLQIGPQKRPSVTQLLQHSFFKSVRPRSSSTLETLPDLLKPVQPLSDIIKALPKDESGQLAEITENLSTVEIGSQDPWNF